MEVSDSRHEDFRFHANRAARVRCTDWFGALNLGGRMSIKYSMTCVCDGCGAVLCVAEPKASSIDSARWDMNDHLKKIGAMTRELYRRPTRHYCKPCADGSGRSAPND